MTGREPGKSACHISIIGSAAGSGFVEPSTATNILKLIKVKGMVVPLAIALRT
jgi:hypothetical protein